MRKRAIRVAALALLILPAWASGAGRRIRLGGLGVSAGYMSGPAWWGPGSAWYGPGLWRPYGPAWWDPWWYNGWAHPGFWGGFVQGPGMGEVKVSSAPKGSLVYIDGAYAGLAGKLKSMWLEPGAYNLRIRSGDQSYEKRIYVLSGKTLELQAALKPKAEVSK
jgi:hypothetical protein